MCVIFRCRTSREATLLLAVGSSSTMPYAVCRMPYAVASSEALAPSCFVPARSSERMGVFNSVLLQSCTHSAIHRLTECIDRADVTALHRLSEAHDFPAEFVPLAKRVEVLLSAHERLLDRARSISIGINHDLRTPLHVLVVQTEVSLCSPRSVAEYEALLQSNMEEFQRLSAALNVTLRKLQALGRQSDDVDTSP